ncbi:hypothetical protein Efla_004733 [Eimeria flavescens]
MAQGRTSRQTTAEEARVLECVTKPASLKEGSKPFTEDEFKTLSDAVSNTAGAVLLAVAALTELLAASIAL